MTFRAAINAVLLDNGIVSDVIALVIEFCARDSVYQILTLGDGLSVNRLDDNGSWELCHFYRRRTVPYSQSLLPWGLSRVAILSCVSGGISGVIYDAVTNSWLELGVELTGRTSNAIPIAIVHDRFYVLHWTSFNCRPTVLRYDAPSAPGDDWPRRTTVKRTGVHYQLPPQMPPHPLEQYCRAASIGHDLYIQFEQSQGTWMLDTITGRWQELPARTGYYNRLTACGGKLYAISSTNTEVYCPESKRWTCLQHCEGAGDDMRSDAVTVEGRLWYTDDHCRLRLYDPTTNEHRRVNPSAQVSAAGRLFSLQMPLTGAS